MAADADAPAAVAVPAQRLHRSALDGNDRRAETAQQIVSEMAALEAEGAAAAEIAVMRVPVALRDRAERLDAIDRLPAFFARFRVRRLHGIAAHKAAKRGLICLSVIVKIAVLRAEQLLRRDALRQLRRRFFRVLRGKALSAGAHRPERQNVQPRDRDLLFAQPLFERNGALHGLRRQVEVHPADKIALRCLRRRRGQHHRRRQQKTNEPFPHKTTSLADFCLSA